MLDAVALTQKLWYEVYRFAVCLVINVTSGYRSMVQATVIFSSQWQCPYGDH